MKAKWLSFVFIYFSESGLFNGLRAKKLKKFRSRLTRVSGCVRKTPQACSASPFSSPAAARGQQIRNGSYIALISPFGKQMRYISDSRPIPAA
jgi:hypothetical protein